MELEARKSCEQIASRSEAKTIDLVDPLEVWGEVKMRKQAWQEARCFLDQALSMMRPDLNPNAPKVAELKKLLAVVSTKYTNP